MRLFLPFCLLASAAVAQVPAHSTVGTLTMDVVDMAVPVTYGTTEAKAAISLCDSQEVGHFQVTVFQQDASGNITFYTYDVAAAKVGQLYCASVVSTVTRGSIPSIDVQAMRLLHFAPAPPAIPSASVVRK